MKIKIGLTGTHGNGKTTLLYSLAGHLKDMGYNVSIVEETARKCPMPVNQDGKSDAQFWIQSTHIKDEIERMNDKSAQIILTDRTLLCHLAYAIDGMKDGRIPKADAEMMKRMAFFWLPSYDFIFFVQPLGNVILEDGFRDTDEKWRLKIHSTIEELIKESGVKVYDLTGTTQERIQKILEVIDLPKQMKLNAF